MAKYKYVGDGKEAPDSIKFMGKVRFYKDHGYVEVTDSEVLAKLKNHPCFVEKDEKEKRKPKSKPKSKPKLKAKAKVAPAEKEKPSLETDSGVNEG